MIRKCNYREKKFRQYNYWGKGDTFYNDRELLWIHFMIVVKLYVNICVPIYSYAYAHIRSICNTV